MGANTLTLGDINNTAASFTGSGMIDAGANQTFSAADALSSFTGTVSVNANTLTLGGINTTAAAITGSGVIDADANQVFTGDVSGFTGSFDIKEGTEVQLNGTFGSTINAFGGTLTLADKGVAVTVNGMTGLADLNFGNNSLTLGTGLFDSVNGTGSVVFDAAHTDNSFTSLTAGSVTLTNGRDIEATEFDGNLYITINSAATSNVADLTTGSTLNDAIYVTIDDASKVAGGYKVVTAGGYDITGIQLWNGTDYITLSLNDGVKVGGYTYTLREEGLTWVLNQLSAYSNIVYVNADWSGKDKYQQVIDPVAGDLSIGYNAAKDLASAVSYIRAWTTGSGWNNDGNLQEGDAKIELTAGKYSLSSGTLMTEENEVKQMYVVGRNGEKAVLSGAINGSDGSVATTLTLENVTIQGEIYGGGKLVIQNGADDRATGNVIAAGINNTAATATMANASELVINGGNFGTRSLVGGSVNSGTGTLTVDGATSLVIDNTSGEKLVISSNIYGGSWAESGKVVQNGNANITINAEQETQIRGNIYVSGGAANGGVLEMNGNSTITFTGDASKLTFTGSVNAVDGDRTTETIVFKDFAGTFNGSINGFDTISIEGDTQLSLARRQTQTGDTAVSFTVTADTQAGAGSAMYTVRDANSWEFAKDVTISVTNDALRALENQTIILIDNLNNIDAAGLTYKLADGTTLTAGTEIVDAAGNSYMINYNDAKTQLILTVNSAANDEIFVGNADLTAKGAASVGFVAAAGDTIDKVRVTVDNTVSASAIVYGVYADEATNVTTGDVVVTYDSTTFKTENWGAAAHTGKANQITVNGNTSIIVEDGAELATINNELLVGGIYDKTAAGSKINGNTSVIIGAAKLSGGNIVGGGSGTITGTAGVEINGADIDLVDAAIFGGTAWGGTVSDSYVTINSGEVTITGSEARRAIFGGSSSGAETTDNANVTINGGTVASNIFGGSRGSAVENTSVVVNDGTVSGNIFAAGYDTNGTATNASVTINGGAVSSDIDGQADKTDISSLNIAGGMVTGDVTGFNSITIDVDAVLSGSITYGTAATEAYDLSITGISSLTADVAGAKAIAGDVDDILNSASIDGTDVTIGGKAQIAGAATAATSDDVWASLNKLDNGNLVVAWGRSEAEVGVAFNAFKADTTLAIGEALVADVTSLADGADLTDFDDKKTNGTLA